MCGTVPKRSSRAGLIALVAASFVLAAVEVAWSQQTPAARHYAQGDDRGQSNADTDNGPPSPTLWPWDFFYPDGQEAISQYCATTPENRKDDWEQAYWCETSLADAYVALGTILLVLITFGIGLIAWRQISTNRQQIRAHIALQSAIVEVRNDAIKFILTFSNDGQTPAYNVGIVADTGVFPKEASRSRFRFPDDPRDTMLFGVTRGHDFTKYIRNRDEVARVKSNANERGFIWGTVRYQDIFRKHRSLEFVYRTAQSGNRWILQPAAGGERAN